MSRQYYVYIMTNTRNTVLYTGVTNDLKRRTYERRTYEHKAKLVGGFTKKYNVHKLVYYEIFDDPENAISREKQIKAGPRWKKVELVNTIEQGVGGFIRAAVASAWLRLLRGFAPRND